MGGAGSPAALMAHLISGLVREVGSRCSVSILLRRSLDFGVDIPDLACEVDTTKKIIGTKMNPEKDSTGFSVTYFYHGFSVTKCVYCLHFARTSPTF